MEKTILYRAATRPAMLLGVPMVMTTVVGVIGLSSFLMTDSFIVLPVVAVVQGGLAWICKDRPDIFADIMIYIMTGGKEAVLGGARLKYAPGGSTGSRFFVRTFGAGSEVSKP